MRVLPLVLLLAAACRKEAITLEDLDADMDGSTADVDCNDSDADMFPGNTEHCDGVDNDCDGAIDEESTDATEWFADRDGDLAGGGDPLVACDPPTNDWTEQGGDCDDLNPDVYPGAPETDCADPVDYNCDGSTGFADADEDGFAACEECADDDPDRHPQATELCDGVDNDCDGDVDLDAADATEWFTDADGDGFGVPGTPVVACAGPDGTADNDRDCDDSPTGAAVNPDATEVCNTIDDDCDTHVDEEVPDAPTWYADADHDGFGNAQSAQQACAAPSGYVGDATDCDDLRGDVHTGADEVCDGADNDCDEEVDEDATYFVDWYPDVDEDGYGDQFATPHTACEGLPGQVADHTDCNDGNAQTFPGAADWCNGEDDDCSGTPDDDPSTWSSWYPDEDSDGFGDADAVAVGACFFAPGLSALNTDCNDDRPDINPARADLCNGEDDDCTGVADDDAYHQDFYLDEDGDGYGVPGEVTRACEAPDGWADNTLDCNDQPGSGAAYSPDAVEICNLIDDDCNGVPDDVADPPVWFLDDDEDGFGDPDVSVAACAAPTNAVYVDNSDDCDDGSELVVPGVEACPYDVGGLHYRDVRDRGLSMGTGAYTVDPDGPGGDIPVTVWCDQETDGGGWTALTNPGAFEQPVYPHVSYGTSDVSGSGSCGYAVRERRTSDGQQWTVAGYACGNQTITWRATWDNDLEASEMRFVATLQGQNTRWMTLNGSTLAWDGFSNAYMKCAFWNGDNAAISPAKNQCWSTTLAASPNVQAIDPAAPIEVRFRGGQGCSPDCEHGTGFNIARVYVR